MSATRASAADRARPLRSRILFTWLAVVAVSGVVFVTAVIPNVRGRARADVSRELAVLANVSATAIEAWCRNVLADAQTVAGFPTSRVLVSATPAYEPDPRFREILDEFARLHQAASLTLFDRRWAVRASTTRPMRRSGEEMRFAEAVRARGRDSLELLPGADGRPVVVVAARTPGGDGLVLAHYDPELWLFRLIASSPTGLTAAEALLLRHEDGTLRVLGQGGRGRHALFRVLQQAAGPRGRSGLFATGDGFTEALDENGRMAMAQRRWLHDRGWLLVTRVGSADALKRVNRGLLVLALESVLLVTALTALAQALVWGQRRAHEAALARHQEQLAILLDQANEAMGYLTPDGIVREANRSAKDFCGVQSGLVGRDAFDVLFITPGRATRAAVEESLARTGRATFEAFASAANNERIPVEASLREVVQQGQRLWVFVVRDLRARRESEARIRRLNRLLRATSALGMSLNRAGDEAELFQTACRVAVESGGFRMASVVLGRAEGPFQIAYIAAEPSLEMKEVYPPSRPEDVGRGPSAEAIRRGHSLRVTDLAADGHPPLWRELTSLLGVRSTGSSPIVVGGEIRGAFTIWAAEPDAFDDEAMALIDGTVSELGTALGAIEVRRAHRQLEQRLGAFLATGPVGFVVADASGVVKHANDEFLRIAARSPEELRAGRIDWRTVFPPNGSLAGGEAGGVDEHARQAPRECELTRADGTAIPVLVGQVRTPGVDGETIAIVSDMTQLHEAAESLRQTQLQLLQAQKMETIGQLAGGVAHDFNNLLTVIHGYAELLRAGVNPGSPAAEEVHQILRAVDRGSRLTRQLLAFGRRQVLDPRVVDLGALVGEVEQMLRRLIGSGVQLDCVRPESLGRVLADPGQIEQVIVNLVVNARDAMPEGGRVRVELSDVDVNEADAERRTPLVAGPYVRLEVADEGQGIPADVLPHIFEPFFTTKEAGKGSGLGLATVYGIVKQSGGYVFAGNRAGAGAVFEVLLPRLDDASAAEVARQAVEARQASAAASLAPREPPS